MEEIIFKDSEAFEITEINRKEYLKIKKDNNSIDSYIREIDITETKSNGITSNNIKKITWSKQNKKHGYYRECVSKRKELEKLYQEKFTNGN